ncbi:restriction endonuclease subunit S [Microbacterium sp. NPDC089190]|uniref:restriction endonuclease subunit S n=1 Tax=Microbacterium sp. NPDC089190 TaxID=3155063 RepID=UPI0034506A20
MTRIEELLDALCPDGVRHVVLGDVATTVPGLSGKSKSDFSDGNARYVTFKNVFQSPVVDESAAEFVVIKSGERQNELRLGDVVITGSSENQDDVGMSAVVDREPSESLYLNSFSFAVRFHDAELIPAFTKFLFRGEGVRSQIRKSATGVTRINVSKPRFMQVRIPVPPVAVQEEIVAVLEASTRLEADLNLELEAESNARRIQYEHYRAEAFTRLTTPENWSTLGEVSAHVSSGGTPSTARDDYYGGGIPWVRTQEVDFGYITATGKTISEQGLRNSAAKWIPANCVIVAMYGATAAKVAMNAIPVTTNQACCNLEIDAERADPRYVFHWISSQYEALRSLGEGSQSNLNAKKVRGFGIPVPPLEDQKRLVTLLDGLSEAVEALRGSLSAERQRRRQQYEYHRDRLLSFRELAA